MVLYRTQIVTKVPQYDQDLRVKISQQCFGLVCTADVFCSLPPQLQDQDLRGIYVQMQGHVHGNSNLGLVFQVTELTVLGLRLS